MGQQLHHVLAGEHLLDPDHPAPEGLQFRDGVRRLTADLGGVRGAGAEHQPGRRVEVVGRLQQVVDALLAGDPPDEDDVRRARLDAVARQRVGVLGRRVERGVDAVVDHVHPLRVDRGVGGEDVLPHAAADRDDAVGRLVRRPLSPARQCVAAAQLFGLPGAARLQAVGSENVGHAVQQLGEMAAEVGVPGVGMGDVASLDRRRHRQVDGEHLERAVRAGEPRVGRVSRRVLPRGAEAVDVDIDQPPQLAGQEIDVDPCPAVDVRRKLSGEHRHAHGGQTRVGSWRLGIASSESFWPAARGSGSCR
jgi:hypothetical protein